MQVLRITTLSFFLLFPLIRAQSQERGSLTNAKQREVIKELHFWESMKNAQKKEYRQLREKNQKIRLDQYEALGIMKRGPASQIRSTTWEEGLFKKLENKLSNYKYVKLRIDQSSIEVPLSSFGLFRAKIDELSELEIKKLKPFILKLSQTLSSPEYWDHIAGIEIKVHASPVYKQQFISPRSRLKAKGQEAYLFNLRLSSKRAQEISEIFYAPDFQTNPKLSSLATKVRATGESFRRPVVKDRAPANLKDSDIDCRIYHCQASRRLEISLIKKASQ